MIRDNWTEITKRLERQVLLFPVFVVLLASVSFLFGGQCAAWQWWTAALIALASVWRSKDGWRVSLASNMLFGVVLLAIYVCTCFSVDVFGIDAVSCHMPATRMLIEGWNPYLCATPEAIKHVFGIEPWDMRVLHILFGSKLVWVFNAVAYYFHHDPLAITQPLEFYTYFALAITLWLVLGRWQWALRLGLIFSLGSTCLSGWEVVDNVCGMSIFALMVSFMDALESRRISWLRVLSFTLIAIGAKASGLLACLAMWSVFFTLFIIRERRTWRKWAVKFSLSGLIMLAVLGCFYVSPYYTAYRDFGHPLYPHVSADEHKYPVYDLLPDFHMDNQFFREMSPVARFVNAYFSPTLVQWYYQMKLGVDRFVPTCDTWQWSPETGERNTSPTTFKVRFLLLLSFCVLIFFYREMALMAFLALICAPSCLYGYIRYFKWVDCLICFAIWTLLGCLFKRLKEMRNVGFWFRVCLPTFVPAWGVLFVVLNVMPGAVVIDRKKTIKKFHPQKVFCQVHHSGYIKGLLSIRQTDKRLDSRCRIKTASEIPHSGCHGDPSRVGINGFKLLARHLPNLNSAEVVPLDSSNASNFVFCPELRVYLDPSEHLPELEVRKYSANPSRIKRLLSYPKYMCKMYLSALGIK